MQHRPGDLAHGIVVVDQKDARARERPGGTDPGRDRPLVDTLTTGARKIDVDRRALAHPGIDAHAPARLLGEAQHLAQTEAGALAGFLGGEERLKYLGADLLRHAGPAVRHTDRHIVAGRRLFGIGGRHERDVLDLDLQGPAHLHGVTRVDGQVEHRELELGRVDQRAPQTVLEHGLDMDASAHRALQKVAHPGDGLVEVERSRLEPLTAREGQQLVGELRAAFRGRPHIADPLGQPAVDARGRKSPFNEPDVAQHHGEKIVEVVGDSGRELADGLQSLHLPQGRFDALAFLDLPEQLAIGRRQLRGPFVDPRLQILVEMTAFILTAAGAQAGLHHADQRGRVKRALEECDAAEQLHQPGGGRVAFQAAAMLGQQDEREIGPRRLRADPVDELPQIGAAGRLLGHDGDVGAALDLLQQLGEIETDFGSHGRVAQDALGDHGVAPAGREDEGPLGNLGYTVHARPSSRGSLFPT